MKTLFGMAVVVGVAVMTWRIGENLTPEIVAMGTGMLLMLLGSAVGVVALAVIMKFMTSDRADERYSENHARLIDGQNRQKQPPVLIVMQDRARIEDKGEWVNEW